MDAVSPANEHSSLAGAADVRDGAPTFSDVERAIRSAFQSEDHVFGSRDFFDCTVHQSQAEDAIPGRHEHCPIVERGELASLQNRRDASPGS